MTEPNTDRAGAAAEWRKGWPVVLAGLLGTAAVSIHINALGPLIQPIQAGTGWSRQQVVMGYTIATLMSIGLQPIAGALIDRFGVRRVAAPGLALYGLCLVYLSNVGPEVWSWLLGWGFLAVAASALMSVWVTGVSGHFNRGRGMAIAVCTVGAGLNGAIAPFVTAVLESKFGWRGAFLGLSAFPLLVVLPVVVTLFRDARFMGGAAAPAVGGDGAHGAPKAAGAAVGGLSVREILQSRNFWQIALACVLVAAAGGGLAIHFVPILVDLGVASQAAAALVAWVGIGAFVGPLVAGWLLDRFHGRLVAVAFSIGAVLGVLVIMAGVNNPVVLSVAMLVIGLSMVAVATCVPYLAGRYFGLKNFGFAFSIINAAAAAGGGISPLLGGMAYDRFHTYWHFELAAAIAFGLAGLVLVTLGAYPSPQEASASNHADGARVTAEGVGSLG